MGVFVIDGFELDPSSGQAFVCTSGRIKYPTLRDVRGFSNAALAFNDQLRECAELLDRNNETPYIQFDVGDWYFRGLAIAAHNLGSAGAEFRIGFYTDGAWEWSWRGEVSTDDPIVFLFPNKTVEQIRVQIMNNSATRQLVKIGYIRALRQIHMGRPDQYSARVPQAAVGAFSSNVPLSGVGVPLLQIQRAPTATRRFAFRNLSRQFAERWISEFRRLMVKDYMIAASDPLNSPDDVAFGWCAGVPPEPVPQGEADLFSWEFKMGCYLG